MRSRALLLVAALLAAALVFVLRTRSRLAVDAPSTMPVASVPAADDLFAIPDAAAADATSDASDAPDANEEGDAAEPSAPDADVVAPVIAKWHGDADAGSEDARCAPFVERTVRALSAFVHRERARVSALDLPGERAGAGGSRVDTAFANTVQPHLPKHLCHATRGGAWSLVLEDFRGDLATDLRPQALAKDPPAPNYDNPRLAAYERVHVTAKTHLYFLPNGDLDGGAVAPTDALEARAPAPWSIASSEDGTTVAFSALDDLQSGDVDGDGVDEALVLSSTGEDGRIEGPGTKIRRSRVFTVANHAIAPFPMRGVPVVRLEAMVDADHDGRQDFLSSAPFTGVTAGPLGDFEIEGPPLLIHSRADGGFSRDDDAARAYARVACPRRPARLFTPKANATPDALDGGTGGLEVYLTEYGSEAIRTTACARLWGVPEDTLRGWLIAASGGAELIRWSTLPPPLVLYDP